ncbi:uroporphyrinogen-III C-methyltransferase [Orbus wheelerorum]|uniref:uroporphyrinogen-III C-methyltransferase n=1 Tax=Orbus wheelerorum TaxID=3074111 RepID=UPI00370D7ACB
MSQNNLISSNSRFFSANATLSNISVTASKNPDSQNLLQSSLSKSSPIGNQIQPQQVKQDMKKNTENTPLPSQDKKNSQELKKPITKIPVSKLSIIAIGLTICLGGFIYYHAHEQAMVQKAEIDQLQAEISTLKDTLQQSITRDIQANVSQAVDNQNKQFTLLTQNVKNQLSEQIQTQQEFINKVDDAIKVSEQNIIHFNERLSAMSSTDNKSWLISQANYLVNLAGRKIWNDQDYTTARLLLKNADASLAQASDPSLLPARQAINKDISALAAISFTDFDGIVMTLMELVDSVTELPLADNYQQIDLGMTQYDDTISNQESDTENNDLASAPSSSSTQTNGISSSIGDWYDNLIKGSESFFAKFIQVEKYDSFNKCIVDAGQNPELLKKCQVHTAIIMPEQALYLRENIKLRLLIAAQAVPRHQQLIYQRALDDVAIWVNAYFDGNSPSVKVFLDELNNLQQQSISNKNVPKQLASQKELDTLMQTRVRAMLVN